MNDTEHNLREWLYTNYTYLIRKYPAILDAQSKAIFKIAVKILALSGFFLVSAVALLISINCKINTLFLDMGWVYFICCCGLMISGSSMYVFYQSIIPCYDRTDYIQLIPLSVISEVYEKEREQEEQRSTKG